MKKHGIFEHSHGLSTTKTHKTRVQSVQFLTRRDYFAFVDPLLRFARSWVRSEGPKRSTSFAILASLDPSRAKRAQSVQSKEILCSAAPLCSAWLLDTSSFIARLSWHSAMLRQLRWPEDLNWSGNACIGFDEWRHCQSQWPRFDKLFLQSFFFSNLSEACSVIRKPRWGFCIIPRFFEGWSFGFSLVPAAPLHLAMRTSCLRFQRIMLQSLHDSHM